MCRLKFANSARSAQEEDCAQEETSGGDGHENNGVAVSGLGFWRRCGCVVLTLRASLCVSGIGDCEESCEECDLCEATGFHWKKARRAQRKIQKMPMACQYHAAPSTKICRDSRCLET